MRFVISLCCFLLLICSGARAQPRYSPEKRAEKEVKWIHDSLHVSDVKLKKIKDILLAYNRKADSINDAGGKYKERNQQKLRKKKNTDIRSLLTKEQYSRYYKREQLVLAREVKDGHRSKQH